MAFAKLFETEAHGQILVKLDEGTDETVAEVRFYCEPPGLGVCSFAAGFGLDGNEEGAWEKAEAMFDKIDEAEAISAIQGLLKLSSEMTTTAE